MRLSICIVNWNTRDYLGRCLRSLREHPFSAGETEIIVVDNASADGSADMVRAEFPDVQLLANADNAGYAAGNNQAIRASHGEWVLLLNPDTEAQPGAIDALVACLERHPQAGAVGAKLVNPDGSYQRSCRSFPSPLALFFDAVGLARAFPRSRFFGRYRMTYWDYDTEREVDQPAGSVLLLRRQALDPVGLMDEQFPIFFNDVDLCYRLRQAGWQIYFCPDARFQHRLGASTRQVRGKMILRSVAGLRRFYDKHYRHRYPRPLYRVIIAAILLAGGARWAAFQMSARRRSGD